MARQNAPRGATTALGAREPRSASARPSGPRGRARGVVIVELALAAPVLAAFLLVIGELGILAVRVIGWQQMTGAIADAADGALPDWTAAELARQDCDGPVEYVAGDPPRVIARCVYRLRLVNGAAFPATLEAIAAPATPAPTPEATVSPIP